MSTMRKSARAPGAIRPRSSRPSAGAADRGGRKDIGCTDRVRLARGHSRQDRGGTQLLDEIMRKGVGADPEIDPGGTILPEILEQDAAPREHRRAVRYGCTGFGKVGEVVAGRPVQPGMMVEKDRVADNRTGTEHADLAQPFDRRFPVPPHDLVKLDDAL